MENKKKKESEDSKNYNNLGGKKMDKRSKIVYIIIN